VENPLPGSNARGRACAKRPENEIVRIGLAMPLPHADPADRFLAATAKVLKLTLVTADQKLLGLGEIAKPGQPLDSYEPDLPQTDRSVERPQMPADVVIVGGGPPVWRARCAWRS